METNQTSIVSPTGSIGPARSPQTSTPDPLAFFDVIIQSAEQPPGQSASAFSFQASHVPPTQDESLRKQDRQPSLWENSPAESRSDQQSHPAVAPQTREDRPNEDSLDSGAGQGTTTTFNPSGAQTAPEVSEQQQSDVIEIVEDALEVDSAGLVVRELPVTDEETRAPDPHEIRPNKVVESSPHRTENVWQSTAHADSASSVASDKSTATSDVAVTEGLEESAPAAAKSDESDASRRQVDNPTEAQQADLPNVAEATVSQPGRTGEDLGGKSSAQEQGTAKPEPAVELDSAELAEREDSPSPQQREKPEKSAADSPQGEPPKHVVESTATATGTSLNSDSSAKVAAVAPPVVSASSAASGTAPTPAENPSGQGLVSLLQRGLQQGKLQRTGDTSSTPQLDPKQQIRLINRVAKAVESTPPGESIRIRLHPSELGALKLEVKIEQGNMIARLEAENPGTRQILLENLPQLRERLAELGIQVQQFDVDSMQRQPQSDAGTSQTSDQAGDSGRDTPGRREPSRQSGEEEQGSPTSESRNIEAELNSRNLNITI